MTHDDQHTPRAVTRGPRHHFLGYYDKCPWDATGRYMLALEVAIRDRLPTDADVATVGLIDLADSDRWQPLDETRAWCWQQGNMLQWLPSAPDRRILYNRRDGDRWVTVIRDIFTGESRTLPLPIHAVSRDGRCALSLNYARLHAIRPCCGYPGLADPWEDDPHPAGDGIHWLDLASGEHRLIISLEQMAHFQPKPSMAGARHFLNHLLFNTDSTRFLCLQRWHRSGERHWETRMFTAKVDGSEMFCVADEGRVSHFDWRNPRQILATARHEPAGEGYYLYTDRTDERELIGPGVLTRDGHCSFSPDGRWVLTDTSPDSDQMRDLLLYHFASGRRVDIGRFFSPPGLTGRIRCDLHPRWSRDGRQVCIDSAHVGSRQMYVVDVA
jgi:hypothetical protein